MTEPLRVAPNPCKTCPYRRATPVGIWDATEYERLQAYDADPCLLPPFVCHEPADRGTVCKGWLVVHRESVAVRLSVLRGQLRAEDVPRDHDPKLYPSGVAAALAGLRGIARPSPEALAIIARLHKKSRRRRYGR